MGKSAKEIIEEEYGTDVDEYKKDFLSLVLEAEDIISFSEEDKKFLENFEDLLNLSIVSCKLKSLENLPKLDKLERLELYDNNISEGLKHLVQYPNLKVIKLGGNKIKSLDEIAELKALKEIENIDFIENPVSKEKEYSSKMWEMFSSLKVLDGLDKDGEECLSELEDEGDFEEGEGLDGDFIDAKDLTADEIKQLEKQGFKFLEGEGEFFEEAEGEGDEGDAEEGAEAGKKRDREAQDSNVDANKRQKTEE